MEELDILTKRITDRIKEYEAQLGDSSAFMFRPPKDSYTMDEMVKYVAMAHKHELHYILGIIQGIEQGIIH